MQNVTERTRRAARAGKGRAVRPRTRAFLAAQWAARCALLLGLLLPAPVYAEKQPPAAAKAVRKAAPVRARASARVRTVVYQEANVVPVVVHSFRVALIEFAADEVIQTARIGDSEGWEVSPNEQGNRLFLKARLEGVSSNLLVVTDRRTYAFDLESRREGDRPADTTYHVRFVYPEEERSREAEHKRQEEQRQQALVSSGRAMDPDRLNFQYGFAGERQLVPQMLFDDGEFTYFRFASVEDLPAIFVVGESKQESLANYRIEGAYVIVQRVAAQFSIRRGEKLACIFNELKKDEAPSPPVNGPRERGNEETLLSPKRPGHYVSRPGPGWRPAPR